GRVQKDGSAREKALLRRSTMTSSFYFVLFALLTFALVQCSDDSSEWDKAREKADAGLAVMEQCGNDDMKATAKKLRKIEKEVDEAIKAAKKSMQQFIEIPSVLIKDTMMKGMKGLVESSGTVFKTAEAAINAIKDQIPKLA
ncbi:hypothetical protein PRIPAC_96900, partial [Pristionchus pacificus]|uniref:Uncharacterized protein n=1 Tax=Pristionchus pacificus TaxID=54126 RepID=A0A2A6BK30_PRIPA